jgi:hypothetical protein
MLNVTAVREYLRSSQLRMNRLVFLVIVLGIGQGCGTKSTTDEASLVFYQVRFDLPWKVDPKQMVASRPRPPAVGFTLSSGNWALGYLNGRLTLNGKDYGTVKAGDSVKVTQDGKVFVNGEERTASAWRPGGRWAPATAARWSVTPEPGVPRPAVIYCGGRSC